MKARVLIRRMPREFLREMSDREFSTYASSTSFFLFLSMVPLCMILTFLLPLTGMECDQLITAAAQVLPEFMQALVIPIIRSSYMRTSMVPVMTWITLIWSSASGVTALVRGLRFIYRAPRHRYRFMTRFYGILGTLAMVVALVACVGIFVLSSALVTFLDTEKTPMPWVIQMVINGRYVVLFLIYSFLLTLLYHFVSHLGWRLRSHMPGALLSSVSTVVFTELFTIYIKVNRSYTTVYGTLATLVLLLLWGYFCIMLIFTGAYLNRAIVAYREEKKGEAPHVEGRRPAAEAGDRRRKNPGIPPAGQGRKVSGMKTLPHNLPSVPGRRKKGRTGRRPGRH